MDSRRKLLFIITDLSAGGAQAALFRLVTSPAIRKYAPEVVSLVDEGVWGPRLQAAGVPISCLGMKPGHFPGAAAISRLVHTVRAVSPTLLQGWMYHGNLAASFAALAQGRGSPKVVWSIRHALHDPKSDPCATRFLIRLGAVVSRSTKGVLFNSLSAAEQHFRIGYPRSKSGIIPNGLDLTGFGLDSISRLEWRKRLGIPSSAVVIGTLARYHPTKDFPTMIRVLGHLHRMQREGALSCYGVFAGESVTPENAELMQIVRAEGLEKFVRLIGSVESPQSFLPALDIGFLASRSEAFPNFILEAMASGLPVVATDVGDCRALIGESGLVCTPGDVAGLADSLNYLLVNEEERTARGELGRARVHSNYSLEEVAARYAEYYQRIIEG